MRVTLIQVFAVVAFSAVVIIGGYSYSVYRRSHDHYRQVSCGAPLCDVAACNDGTRWTVWTGPNVQTNARTACADHYGVTHIYDDP